MQLLNDVRALLEPYQINSFHNVVRNGDLVDGRLYTEVEGLHVGDLTPYGRITSLDFCIVCERPIEKTPLEVKVYDYVSDEFIERTFETQIRPIVRRYAPVGEEKCTEWVEARNGKAYLSHRDILQCECTGLSRVDQELGVIYGSFEGAVQVSYTYGGDFEDVARACALLTASFVLGYVGAQTGGGSLSVQGYSRNYGARGKWHDIRQDFDRAAYELLQKHVVGIC